MNKARRRQIAEVINSIEIIKGVIEEIRDDEEDAYDNMPESLQESDRGEAMQEAVEFLENACDSLDEALDNLTNI